MTDSMDPLLCGAFLVFLILIDAIQTAYENSVSGATGETWDMVENDYNQLVPALTLSNAIHAVSFQLNKQQEQKETCVNALTDWNKDDVVCVQTCNKDDGTCVQTGGANQQNTNP